MLSLNAECRYFPGVAGLNGTAGDYFKFAQMLLNGGEYNGQRLLGRMTVNVMLTNQIGSGKNVYVRGPGHGFGLGGGVLQDPSKSVVASQTVVDTLADQRPKVAGYATPD